MKKSSHISPHTITQINYISFQISRSSPKIRKNFFSLSDFIFSRLQNFPRTSETVYCFLPLVLNTVYRLCYVRWLNPAMGVRKSRVFLIFVLTRAQNIWRGEGILQKRMDRRTFLGKYHPMYMYDTNHTYHGSECLFILS